MEVRVQAPSSCAATDAEDEADPEDGADDAVEGEVGESEHAPASAARMRIGIKTGQLRISSQRAISVP